jgi:hypothetical protein
LRHCHKEKISAFNKPVVDEAEVRRQQMKKASFLAKLNKFESPDSAKENKNTESLRWAHNRITVYCT